MLISLLGNDVVNLVRALIISDRCDEVTPEFGFQAEPILAALKPRLLDDINDPRLSLRAYLVVMQQAGVQTTLR